MRIDPDAIESSRPGDSDVAMLAAEVRRLLAVNAAREPTPIDSDIVDRLRAASHYTLMDAAREWVREAADEIERLREGRELDGESIGVLVGECQAMLGRAIDCQEWSEKSAALLWKIQVQSNIIARLKTALEKR